MAPYENNIPFPLPKEVFEEVYGNLKSHMGHFLDHIYIAITMQIGDKQETFECNADLESAVARIEELKKDVMHSPAARQEAWMLYKGNRLVIAKAKEEQAKEQYSQRNVVGGVILPTKEFQAVAKEVNGHSKE